MQLFYVAPCALNRDYYRSHIGHIYDSRNAPSYAKLSELTIGEWYTVVWQNELDIMQYTDNDMYDPPVYTYVEFAYKDGRKRMFNVNEIHVLPSTIT